MENYEKVMYIDIDVHHGDGVEEAFKETKDVLTISFHAKEEGFYPGSGGINSIDGKNNIFNFPLKEGTSDHTFLSLFSHFVPLIKQKFQVKYK